MCVRNKYVDTTSTKCTQNNTKIAYNKHMHMYKMDVEPNTKLKLQFYRLKDISNHAGKLDDL